MALKTIQTVGDVLPKQDAQGRPVLGVLANNMVVPLALPCVDGLDLVPLTRADPFGFDIHRASLVFLLAKCAAERYPGATFRVRHSIGPALWCTLTGADVPSPDVCVVQLKADLQALIAADEPIDVEPVPYKDAVDFFSQAERFDELHLLKHRNPPMVVLSRCGAFRALNQVTLAPRSGLLAALWDLVAVDDGLVLNVPSLDNPDVVAPLPYTEPYFRVFRRQTERTRITGVETMGDLNQTILENRFDDLVRTVEALQDKELSRIADDIAIRKPSVRLVLIAGPSSAGKTTTARRLATHLRVNGLKPRLLSTDDYFVGDARNPRDANGQLDYETVEAVDAERLAADLNALFAGRPVHLRAFDFIKHDGFDRAAETTLPPNGVIILEGIHALNPVLTRGIADDVKFRIYLNALTQLVVDSCNRLSATDTRLLRRLVRDFNFRGRSPIETFKLWDRVVVGERKWIYPYQGKADAVFNSALDYELAVLKPYASRLLNQVKPWHKEFAEARRLSGILHNVSIASDHAVPGNSILRETIGGSQLDY